MRGGSVRVGAAVVALLLAGCDTTTVPRPPTPRAQPSPVLAGPWVTSLPVGEPPTVPYVGDGTVHLRDREVRLRGYSDVSMVGPTVAGTIVLAERDRPRFATSYLLVRPDGATTRLADGGYHRAREGVVSPDGRSFAHDETVRDLTDLSVVAQIPRNAKVLVSWTGEGIRYLGRGTSTFVWRPGSAPRRVTRSPARGLTRSPDGRWLVTRRLVLLDTATGDTTSLAGAPLGGRTPVGPGTAWEDDRHLLVSLSQDGVPPGEHGVEAGVEVAFLARCDVVAATCERVTGAVPVTVRRTIELSPYR